MRMSICCWVRLSMTGRRVRAGERRKGLAPPPPNPNPPRTPFSRPLLVNLRANASNGGPLSGPVRESAIDGRSPQETLLTHITCVGPVLSSGERKGEGGGSEL